jgi:hypothetical protein
MKPKMSAAQLEARRKAGLSTSDPTHACSGAISNAKPDCEEKRDPDKRSLIIQKKENELDPDTQLEKPTFKNDFFDAVTQVRQTRALFCRNRRHRRLRRHLRLGFLPNAVEFRDPGLDSRDVTDLCHIFNALERIA